MTDALARVSSSMSSDNELKPSRACAECDSDVQVFGGCGFGGRRFTVCQLHGYCWKQICREGRYGAPLIESLLLLLQLLAAAAAFLYRATARL